MAAPNFDLPVTDDVATESGLEAAVQAVVDDLHARGVPVDAAAKAVLVAADQVGVVDSEASDVLKRATLAAFADYVYGGYSAFGAALDAKSPLADADIVALLDSEDSNAAVKATIADLRSKLQGHYDTVYHSQTYINAIVDQTTETVEDDLVIRGSDDYVLARISPYGPPEFPGFKPWDWSNAKGARGYVSARLAQSLDDYGLLKQPYFGLHYLRETRQRLRALQRGLTTTLDVAMIGDSFTHNAARYSGDVADVLYDGYGDAGAGWVGFAAPPSAPSLMNGNVRPDQVTYSETGAWTSTSIYNSTGSPDLGSIQSSTASDKLTITGYAHTAAKLFAIQTADGMARYRWDGGSWAALDLTSGSGVITFDLASVPAGAFTLEIEVVSGTVQLCGVNLTKTAAGVRVHKIACSGSWSELWSAADADWDASLGLLAPNAVLVMLGTNDQGTAYDSPATFSANITTLIGRIRAELPAADVFLIMPPENQRDDNPWPMADYTAAAKIVAADERCAFLDLQFYFGEAPADYADGSDRSWWSSDEVHPTEDGGGPAIADPIIRALLYAL